MFRSLRLSPVRLFAALTVLALASVSVASATGTLSPTITVNSKVDTNCTDTVFQPGTITYDPLVTNATAAAQQAGTASAGSIVLNCTKGATVTIDLDQGANPLGNAPSYTRQMIAGQHATPALTSQLLQYQIYYGTATTTQPNAGTGPQFTTSWGINTGGSALTETGLGPGNGNRLTDLINISIPGAQNVQADTYVDTVTATISY